VYTAERQATFDKKRAKRAVSKAAADAKAKALAEAGGAAGEGGAGAGAAAAGTEKEERPIPDGPPKLLILEALSATGLRSVRYWNEIANVDKIISNDFSEAAVELIRRNVVHNGINPETEVVPSQGDATLVMHQHRASDERLFDVIDLDPYGGANPFLDAAVHHLHRHGGACRQPSRSLFCQVRINANQGQTLQGVCAADHALIRRSARRSVQAVHCAVPVALD
jgi:tRNA (guanine26-N2/guanine27-N2)-dimethyltransferase